MEEVIKIDPYTVETGGSGGDNIELFIASDCA